jgi:putative redox protein
MDLISITQEENSTFKSQIRKHEFLSDMAVRDGGNDEAPAPAEFLVSSLGNCIGMVIYSYCTAHGYSSQNINLSMTYLLADNPKRIKNITIDIALPENFPCERQKAIMNLIKLCPIYNSLHPDMEIDIEFEE